MKQLLTIIVRVSDSPKFLKQDVHVSRVHNVPSRQYVSERTKFRHYNSIRAYTGTPDITAGYDVVCGVTLEVQGSLP